MGTEAKAAAKSSPPEAAERDTASSTTLPAAASSTRAAAATAATWARRMLPRGQAVGPRRRHRDAPLLQALAAAAAPAPARAPAPVGEPPRAHHGVPEPGALQGLLPALLPEEDPPGEVQGVDELVGADGADEDERAAA